MGGARQALWRGAEMRRLRFILGLSRLLGLHAYFGGYAPCLNLVVEEWENL